MTSNEEDSRDWRRTGGPEAALTAARLGCDVELYEMRAMVDGKPRLTPATRRPSSENWSAQFAESESPNTAPWLLKEEMRRAGSALLRIADASAVPAGHALAVDRVEFSRRISEAIAAEPRIRVVREEVTRLDLSDDALTILATGPLTSDALSAEIERITGAGHLAFYDSISPLSRPIPSTWSGYILPRAGTRDGGLHQLPDGPRGVRLLSGCAAGSRAGRGQRVEKLDYFEGCLPIEVLARRGRDTLRFGPMKPVGLRDPRTGRIPGPWCSCARKTCALTVITWWAFRTI